MKREARSSIDVFEGYEGTFRNLHAFSRALRERRDVNQRVHIIHRPVNKQLVKEQFHALAGRLCAEHPSISTDKGIFGGIPHIKDVRLSVGDVLAQLYIYGSIQEVLNIYSPDVTEEQIKEAIAYAQDFLESACES